MYWERATMKERQRRIIEWVCSGRAVPAQWRREGGAAIIAGFVSPLFIEKKTTPVGTRAY